MVGGVGLRESNENEGSDEQPARQAPAAAMTRCMINPAPLLWPGAKHPATTPEGTIGASVEPRNGAVRYHDSDQQSSRSSTCWIKVLNEIPMQPSGFPLRPEVRACGRPADPA